MVALRSVDCRMLMVNISGSSRRRCPPSGFAIVLMLLLMSGIMSTTPSHAASISGGLVLRVAHAIERGVTTSNVAFTGKHMRCIVCEKTACAGHQAVLPTTSPGAVALPQAYHPLAYRMAAPPPPSHAPPAIARDVGSSFDPRGPPSVG